MESKFYYFAKNRLHPGLKYFTCLLLIYVVVLCACKKKKGMESVGVVVEIKIQARC